MRQRVKLVVDVTREIPEPTGRLLQFVARLDPVAPPLQALLVGEPDADRMLVYFPGFNTPLGPWESAKCRMLAESFGRPVLLVEIPGMSHYGDPLPAAVRRTMLGGKVQDWADLMVDYQLAALESLGHPMPASIDVLGYSAGCSLGVAALGHWQQRAEVRSVTLVEPVATRPRNLVTLELHNAVDVLRQPASYATNHGHDWVMRARRRQLREPWVRYGPADLLAIAQVLAQPQLPGALPLDGSIAVNLVRGERSDLCEAASFDALHDQAPAVGVTVDVQGFGHPLWHSFPVLQQLVPALGAGAQQGGGSVIEPPSPR